MSAIGRRTLLHGAVVAIALPLAAAAQDSRTAPPHFAPPPTPMLYTRRLERGLAGGASLTVTRRFAVRFVHEGGGFRVDGEQVEVTVEAPPQLATLAELERERVESGLFPLRLDAAGTIVGQSPPTVSAQLDAAVREVTAQIERGPHSPVEREQLRAFVEAVHRSSAELATELPRELFAPGDNPFAVSRELSLPGGETGTVRVSFSGQRDPATGLMREARREVVTEVAGDRRHTVESWTLAPFEN